MNTWLYDHSLALAKILFLLLPQYARPPKGYWDLQVFSPMTEYNQRVGVTFKILNKSLKHNLYY
jgi:hypothetical protein